MDEERVQALRQRRLEDLCGAALRAVSGQPQLQWRGGRLWRGTQRLPRFAAHLHPVFGQADLASLRGAADGLALRVSRSDAERALVAEYYQRCFDQELDLGAAAAAA